MKSRIKTLVEKSIAAMQAAVEIVNRPKYGYREEIFVLLCINAWELLIKAKWLNDHNGAMSCLYVKQQAKNDLLNVNQKSKQHYKKTRSKNPMTHELMYLIRQMNANKRLIEENVIKNIELLLEARDNATHFFNHTAKIDSLIRGVGIASVRNYVELIQEWFNISLDEFGFCLVPVSAIDTPHTIRALSGNKAEKQFVDFMEQMVVQQEQDTTKSVSIVLSVKMTKSSQISQGVSFQVDPNSKTKIAISEEDMLAKYPLSYHDLANQLKERYTDFSQNKKFNAIMKKVKADKSCCLTRYLNPKKKTSKADFYNTNAFRYFDKVHTRRK